LYALLSLQQASLAVTVVSDPSIRYERVQTHHDDV